MRLSLTLSFAAIVTLSGCTAVPNAAPPPPEPAPAPIPMPAPAPAPALGPDWRDWPVTPGTWTYRADAGGSLAAFGRPGAAPDFTLRCVRAQGQVVLSRAGGGLAQMPMTVTTSTAVRQLTAQAAGAEPGSVAVTLGARDSLLDAMGYSRGRFVVRAGDLPPLVLPAWAEVLRVVEDCR